MADQAGQDRFEALWRNPQKMQQLVQAMLSGKHIDYYIPELFGFLEAHQETWEAFFGYLGYRLHRRDLGGSTYYHLSNRSGDSKPKKLSQAATVLGLFLSLQYAIEGPGLEDSLPAETVFERLRATLPFGRVRPIFFQSSPGVSAKELTEEQAERFKAKIATALRELASYRFIELSPSSRAPFDVLVVTKLPALYRFLELARDLSASTEGQPDLAAIVLKHWGDGASGRDGEEE
jgi:chromosome partition protein MukE